MKAKSRASPLTALKVLLTKEILLITFSPNASGYVTMQ